MQCACFQTRQVRTRKAYNDEMPHSEGRDIRCPSIFGKCNEDELRKHETGYILRVWESDLCVYKKDGANSPES